ncbi:NUDIX hydrolase [Enterococcus sp. LJL120]
MSKMEEYRQLLNLAQAGIHYQKDVYDLERYQEIQRLAVKLIAESSQVTEAELYQKVSIEAGYPTPKVDVRAVIEKDDKILFVEDINTKKWALPGGFADVGLSPIENIKKEVKEETNLDVRSAELIGVFDTNLRQDIFQYFQYYKLFFHCLVEENQAFEVNSETSAIGYFSLDNLPQLSLDRTTKEQLIRLRQRGKQVVCD